MADEVKNRLHISDMGVKLIKAFEGYRPVDRELVNGQRVVGYGHRLYADDPMVLSKADADALLRSDLAAYEDMINENVHAPLNQSQFDALVSLSWNIGPKAFLKSDTLRALNNGRPLDAANGFDIWRKSTIDGKTYVVDALMRRRTAEKALFLRQERPRIVSAGAVELPPVPDETIALLSTEDALPVFSADDANAIVRTVPYEVRRGPARRREDGPAGILTLSEVLDEPDVDEDVDNLAARLNRPVPADNPDNILQDDALDVEATDLAELESDGFEDNIVVGEFQTDMDTSIDADDPPMSKVAEAATEISARLDALIDGLGAEREGSITSEADEAWPDSLVEIEDTPSGDSGIELDDPLSFTRMESDDDAIVPDDKPVNLVIDNLREDEALVPRPDDPALASPRNDSAARYVQSTPVTEPDAKPSGLSLPIVIGMVLAALGIVAMIRGSEQLMGEWGPWIAFVAVVIGSLLTIGSIYLALRRR